MRLGLRGGRRAPRRRPARIASAQAYAEWVATYASGEFAQLAAWCRELTDAAAADVAGSGRLRMHNAFRASSEHELAFWESAWSYTGHLGAVLRHRDPIGQPLLVEALVQVGARLRGSG